VWGEVIAQADKLLQLVADSPPKESFEIQPAQAHIAGMFWRSRRLYEGVLILLKAELPEEAAILARSLFEESLRLQQLAAEPENRDGLILGWANNSINQQRGLLHTAKACGLDPDISATLTILEKRRRDLDQYGARQGVKRRPSFQTRRDAAFRFERKEDFWLYEWSHESVHGSEAAWLFSSRRPAEGILGLYAKANDPELLSEFARFAARSMANAAEAAFAILGWTPVPDFQRPVTDIERLIDSDAG